MKKILLITGVTLALLTSCSSKVTKPITMQIIETDITNDPICPMGMKATLFRSIEEGYIDKKCGYWGDKLQMVRGYWTENARQGWILGSSSNCFHFYRKK